MKHTPPSDRDVDRTVEILPETNNLSSASRRNFLGKVGTAAAATMAAGVIGTGKAALAQSSAKAGIRPEFPGGINGNAP